jgi:3-phenylpropionate/trans-cinnamate dioxygenase ferredoxin reductase subunit
MDNEHCVIIGGGHAAAEAVPALRKEGFAGAITLIGEEPYHPYHRPPLSKTFLADQVAAEAIYIRNPENYAEARVGLRLGCRAIAIDRDGRHVRLDDGGSIPYSALLLATGAVPRRLTIPGAELRDVHYIRGIADIEALRPKVRPGARAVIAGGGYIGLETAAMLRKLKLEVTVIEAMERVLQRVTAPEVSAFYERVHREEGVVIITGAEVVEATPEAIILKDGREVPADILIAGIGVTPDTVLARDCGLATQDGIIVDECCRTSDPSIFAAGDCTRFVSRHYGAAMRLESVQNANDQSRVAAAVIAGRPAVYDAIPWFWSDQYELKLQIAGLSTGYDEIAVRGDIANGRSFAAFYLKQGELISVDAVNRGKEFMAGKRLIAARARIPAQVLADDAVPVAELMKLVRSP